MKKRKSYISLPITGHPYDKVVEIAERYRREYERQRFEVVTPFDLAPEENKPYSYYMGKDIEGLLECDVVFMAPGWVSSKGCNAEYAVARIYGKEVHEL